MGTFDNTNTEAAKKVKDFLKLLYEMMEDARTKDIKEAAARKAARIKTNSNTKEACASVMSQSQTKCMQALTKARDMGYLTEDQFNNCKSDIMDMTKYNGIDDCAVRSATLDALTHDINGRIKDINRGALSVDGFDGIDDMTKQISETLSNARIPDGYLESPEFAKERITNKTKTINKTARKITKTGRSEKVSKILSDSEERAKAAAKAASRTSKATTRGGGAR